MKLVKITTQNRNEAHLLLDDNLILDNLYYMFHRESEIVHYEVLKDNVGYLLITPEDHVKDLEVMLGFLSKTKKT